MLRAEAAAAALKDAEEEVRDALLIAMILKGLPPVFKAFNTVITQKDKQPSYPEFKVALRAYEENEKPPSKDNVMKTEFHAKIRCYACRQLGHKADQCTKSKKWCKHCKSRTHNTNECRKKDHEQHYDGAKSAQEKPSKPQRSFLFQVTDEPEDEGDNISCMKASLLVDCGATTHIINDESKFIRFENDFNSSVHFIELADGSRHNDIALKRGDANVVLHDNLGNEHNVTLSDALYVPSFSQNIFSVQAASKNGASISFHPDKAVLSAGDGTKFDIYKKGRLYYLYSVKSKQCDLKMWHEILGHCNMKDTLKLESVVNGMSISNKGELSECDVCTLGKMINTRSREPDARAKSVLQLVHADLAGPITPESHEGFKYVLAYTDDYSGVTYTYMLKNKSDTLWATEKFLADTFPYEKVKCIRSDNGTEFTSKAFKSLLVKNKIKHETSAPYSPHQNGTAERNWRTLFEMARCLLINAKLDKIYWPYAILTATYIRNRCYNNRIKKTPYQAFTDEKPDISNMAIFGTECFAYTQNKKKLDARCKKGIFLGYDKGSPAYLVLFPKEGKIEKVRNVKFTNKFPFSKPDYSEVELDEDESISQRRADVQREFTPHQVGPNEHNAPEEPLHIEAEPLENEVMNQPEAQPNQNRRYPTRDIRKPSHLNDYVIQDVDDDDTINYNIDYCCSTSIIPRTYEEAVDSEENEKWRKAMCEEMESLKENNTYTLTELPKDKSLVGARWVYTIKEGHDSEVRYKARFVAKGYSQVPEIDYFETYSPIAKITSIRVLMQLVLDLGMQVHQMDVKTAYLNAPIDCEIFIERFTVVSPTCQFANCQFANDLVDSPTFLCHILCQFANDLGRFANVLMSHLMSVRQRLGSIRYVR